MEHTEMHKQIKVKEMVIHLSENTFKELKDAKKYAKLAKEAKELDQLSAMNELKNIANQEIQHYETNKKILENLVTEEDKKHYFYEMQMKELKEMYEEVKSCLAELG